jgi:hypothetical protein
LPHSTGGRLYFNSLKSKAITVCVDGTQPGPITVEVAFDCSTKNEIQGSISVDFLSFSLVLKLTLTNDVTYRKIDALSWVTDLNNLVITPNLASNPASIDVSGSFLGRPVSAHFPVVGFESQFDAFKDGLLATVINVNLLTSNQVDLSNAFVNGIIAGEIRSQIFKKLTDPDRFNQTTLRDSLNSTLNSILLGGVIDPQYQNRCDVVTSGSTPKNSSLPMPVRAPPMSRQCLPACRMSPRRWRRPIFLRGIFRTSITS